MNNILNKLGKGRGGVPSLQKKKRKEKCTVQVGNLKERRRLGDNPEGADGAGARLGGPEAGRRAAGAGRGGAARGGAGRRGAARGGGWPGTRATRATAGTWRWGNRRPGGEPESRGWRMRRRRRGRGACTRLRRCRPRLCRLREAGAEGARAGDVRVGGPRRSLMR